MRRYITLLLALLLALSLVGCGGYTEEDLKKAQRESHLSGYDTGYDAGYAAGQAKSYGEYERGYKADVDEAYERGVAAGQWAAKKVMKTEPASIDEVATVWEDYKYDTTGYVYMETWRYEELIDSLQSIAKVTGHYWDQGYVPVEYVDGYLSNINLSDIYDY